MSGKHFGHDLLQDLTSENLDGPILQQYLTHLLARGHQDATLKAYLRSAAHFTRWLAKRAPDRRIIATDSVCDFIEGHLPDCRCSHPGPKGVKMVRAALNQLLLMQGQPRLLPPRTLTTSDIEVSICAFDAYLRDVCGLAGTTRWNRCHYVRDFLVAQFEDRPLTFSRIVSQDLVQYVTEQARHYRPGTIGALVSALRSYLRFLQFNGTPTINLGEGIPTPPHWSLAALPPSLDKEELERFWRVFDRATAIGKRDYAMTRCLVDLALRCQEVANMRIDAIDWRSAVLHLPLTKARRADLLPLPATTGQALFEYLREGRPVCTSQAIFVYHRAPLGKAVEKTTVRGAIRRAFVRAGLPWSGTHILRHTAATHMLQAGRSLKEIADALRHRSIDTTQIYTKVDLPNLARVAMPWPESQS